MDEDERDDTMLVSVTAVLTLTFALAALFVPLML